jgi:hypothetical protein
MKNILFKTQQIWFFSDLIVGFCKKKVEHQIKKKNVFLKNLVKLMKQLKMFSIISLGIRSACILGWIERDFFLEIRIPWGLKN